MFQDIRPSPIAGRWYKGVSAHLRDDLNRYLGASPVNPYSDLYGVMVPHAGMVFSGAIAGRAFCHLYGRENEYDTVVVISPSHYPFPHSLLTTGHDAFQTPLGEVPVDVAIVQKLTQMLPMEPIRNDSEHGIEIELPFLQYILGEFRLIPIAMMNQSYPMAQQLAEALMLLLEGRQVLYVASSDLSHFYDESTAHVLDRVVLDAVKAYDAEEVIRADDEGRGFACGRGAISTVLLATRQRGAITASIESYATSGDVTADKSRVVGYGSATFHA